MTDKIYTVITFSPVQGFIEKSRKLRDLYGSSYLLSYLSWVICNAAKNHCCTVPKNHCCIFTENHRCTSTENHRCPVISPALPNITQGMPNQIIIEGDFPETNAKLALETAWECVTETCREWVENNVGSIEDYKSWNRSWGLWTKYAWEFFWVQGELGQSITDVREKMNEKKRSRDWTGINWQGESSTLSGTDAIAYPKLGQNYNYQQEKENIKKFYEELSEKLGKSFIKSVGLKVPDDKMRERTKEYGESFIAPNEELSVPELIKRLITHTVIADNLTERLKESFGNNGIIFKNLAEQIKQLSKDLNPISFTDLSRLNKNKRTGEQIQEKFWTGWFQGDGDKAGDYLKSFANKDEEAEETTKFSIQMREWGEDFKKLPDDNKTFTNWRVVYAGGDDFLGVFYDRKDATDCVKFFSKFKSDIWNQAQIKQEQKKITVSVGFVWASPDIPQRDVLQHCREAEKSAKNNGRDRIAFRILFNNGNHLEWVCPWWLLSAGLLSSYQDREGGKNWTHIYNDVAVLESRHAFDDDSTNVAMGLLEIYFSKEIANLVKRQSVCNWNSNWLHEDDANLILTRAGILGQRKNYTKENTDEKEIDYPKVNKGLNNWIINLAKVGFHLCQK
jgi:CRISPR-associated protein Cmr2